MRKTLSEIKMDGDEQKDWNTQDVQVIPNKLPKQVVTNTVPPAQSEGTQAVPLKIGENKIGEETKKYAAPVQFDRDPSMTQRIEEFDKKKEVVEQYIQNIEAEKQVEPEVKVEPVAEKKDTNVVDSFTDEADAVYTLKVRADSDSHYITVELPNRNKSNIKVLEPTNPVEAFKALKIKKSKR